MPSFESALVATRPVASDGARIGNNPALGVPFSLTAAAQQIRAGTGNGGVSGGNSSGRDDWTKDAWTFFDNVGELRFVCAWLSNALSRCTIMGSDVDEDTGQPTGATEDQMVNDVVRDIAGGPAGQAALLGRIATFLTVPGLLYIAIIFRTTNTEDRGPQTVEEWYVLSSDEVKRNQGKVELSLPDGSKHELNDDVDTLAKVYRPHPKNARESDSPVRACIPILREIVRLGQHVESTAKSRLAGNGILLLPQELSMPVQQAPAGQPVPDVDPDAPGLPAPTTPTPTGDADLSNQGLVTRQVTASDVMQALMTAASTAMDDPSSAAGQLPIMLQAPGEFLDKVKHLKMGTEFTDTVMKLREAATRRLALTLDVPAEILLGTGDMNHWSAWQVEESAIKIHLEPLLVLICDSLTEHVLRPMLRLQGHPNPESAVIWYDTTGLAMRPNRSADAKDAHDRGAINTEALMQYLGFADSDALDVSDPVQMKQFVVGLVVKNPQLLSDPVIAELLGLPTLTPAAPTGGGGDTDTDDDANPPVPAEPDEIAARIAAVRVLAQAALQRALSLAGNRMRTRGNLSGLADVPRYDTHTKLPAPSEKRVDYLIQGWTEVLTHEALDAAGANRVGMVKLINRHARNALHYRTPLRRCTFEDAELADAVEDMLS